LCTENIEDSFAKMKDNSAYEVTTGMVTIP